jgi:hypothetical protein
MISNILHTSVLFNVLGVIQKSVMYVVFIENSTSVVVALFCCLSNMFCIAFISTCFLCRHHLHIFKYEERTEYHMLPIFNPKPKKDQRLSATQNLACAMCYSVTSYTKFMEANLVGTLFVLVD